MNSERQRDPVSAFRRLTARMRADLRLAVVTLYGASTFVIIGTFAVYRFAHGQWVIGLVDLVIAVALSITAALAWNPRWTRAAANFYAIIAATAAMITVVGMGMDTMWIFGVLVGNFLLAGNRVAAVTSAILIASVTLQAKAFPTGEERLIFVAVATMVSLFSLIFSTRVETQHGELTRMAERDGLTGALNRRSLDRDLSRLCAQPEPLVGKQSLVVLDVDDFKRLNDNHGHEAGDDILSRLAGIVQSHTRGTDRFYRYGGEEFVLLLDHTDRSQAGIAVGKLRRLLADELRGPGGPITVSMGIAERQAGESANDWFSRADQAMLEAKRAGKDRYEIA